MNEFRVYFNELIKKYDCNVTFCVDKISDKQLEKVPFIMHDFYKVISKAELPFGIIFPLDMALEASEKEPFTHNWFVFGQDNYFSFWLCSYSPDSEGLSFTAWDHEGGSEIGEAADEDIISFLKYEEEEYEENDI